MRNTAMATALATAAALLAGCGGESTFDASGTLSLLGYSQDQVLAAQGSMAGDACQGAGSLAAFDSSAEVVVLDADGSKVAVGELSEGTLSDDTKELAHLGFSLCEFIFTVADVPESDGLYTLVIDESETSFSAEEASSIKVDLAGEEYP